MLTKREMKMSTQCLKCSHQILNLVKFPDGHTERSEKYPELKNGEYYICPKCNSKNGTIVFHENGLETRKITHLIN